MKNTHPLFGPFGTRNGATNPITPQIMDITVKGIIMLGVPCILSTILPAFVPERSEYLPPTAINITGTVNSETCKVISCHMMKYVRIVNKQQG